MSSTCNKY